MSLKNATLKLYTKTYAFLPQLIYKNVKQLAIDMNNEDEFIVAISILFVYVFFLQKTFQALIKQYLICGNKT